MPIASSGSISASYSGEPCILTRENMPAENSPLSLSTTARAGATALGEGLAASLALLARCPAEAARGVVDVSGDGPSNQGRPPAPVRDIGVAAGVTINALAVLSDEADLVAHYREELIGGPGSFVMETPDYAAFAEAIREKLLREIGGSPSA